MIVCKDAVLAALLLELKYPWIKETIRTLSKHCQALLTCLESGYCPTAPTTTTTTVTASVNNTLGSGEEEKGTSAEDIVTVTVMVILIAGILVTAGLIVYCKYYRGQPEKVDGRGDLWRMEDGRWVKS